jgi:NAD(P)-dependent dehydrogenase (short-subunit alcohol dehydrogenase family)
MTFAKKVKFMQNQKIILITGTSRGIGKYLLGELRKNRAYIVYGSSRKKDPTDPFHIQLDVTRPESCSRAIEKILAEQGRLDVLINNAGSHLTGASEETSLEEIDGQMKLNFYGSVYMIKAATPVFLEQKSGKIINMSSLGGLLSLPYTSAYNASKFALEGYTGSLRLELLPLGIAVSNLEPAYIHSGTTGQSIIAPSKDHPVFSRNRKKMHEKMLADSSNGIPLRIVARQIGSIIETQKPKFRYKVGKMTKQLTMLHAIIPEKIFERMVLKSFDIQNKINY